MKRVIQLIIYLCAISFTTLTCNVKVADPKTGIRNNSLVNTGHLDYLSVPVKFANGATAAGVYIYAEAPDYHVVDAGNEGYICVDDVSRAALVYFRSPSFLTDTAIQGKAFKLIKFIIEMQSANGYFYNFIFPGGQINTNGQTSANTPSWWSWRALYTLEEASAQIKLKDTVLYRKVDTAIIKLVTAIKSGLANVTQTTKLVHGITIPQWLPAGSGTDQAALLILGLIPYCNKSNDPVIRNYIKMLADGISMMQIGDSINFPYSCFLSWENTWHAYGNDQAYALFKAGSFLNEPRYSASAFAEVDRFYPWLILNGMQNSFVVEKINGRVQLISKKNYAQIAYGIRPMVFAAIEAFKITGDKKYADIAGHLSAWFLGANEERKNMYSVNTGRCYDGITSKGNINYNSGAESTIEALLTMQMVEQNPEVVTALNKYKCP